MLVENCMNKNIYSRWFLTDIFVEMFSVITCYTFKVIFSCVSIQCVFVPADSSQLFQINCIRRVHIHNVNITLYNVGGIFMYVV